jgi:hypothetical protein
VVGPLHLRNIGEFYVKYFPTERDLAERILAYSEGHTRDQWLSCVEDEIEAWVVQRELGRDDLQ